MNEQERKAGLALGTLPNSHGYREPHICDFPKEGLRVGMIYVCPDCEKHWRITKYEPDAAGLKTTGWFAGTP